jgi:LysM repeat protein
MLILKTMKRLFAFYFLPFIFVTAQTPAFTDFVRGSALPKSGQLEFYLENVSGCVLEQLQLRVATDRTYNTVLETTFITQLQPGTQGTFVMPLTSPTGEGIAWTVDTVTLGQSQDTASCQQAGVVTFEKYDFAGVAQATQVTPAPNVEINRAPTREYTVVAGDSWWSISQRFGSTPEEIAQMNGRAMNTLSVGEILLVPAPAPNAAPETVAAEGSSVASGGTPTTGEAPQLTAYAVKAGDTLFGIARAFETTVTLIRQANCLSEEDVLSVNQNLQIPPKDAVLTNTCN